MNYYSTNKKSPLVSFEEALMLGLPPDNGLYMPERFNIINSDILNIDNFVDLSYEIAKTLLDGCISDKDLYEIIKTCYNFEVPIKEIDKNIFVLELFHGPTCAFKDFGARFMANMTGYFLKENNKKLNIVVATSGDTGSAVANGFFNIKNINVIILYPKGKVSNLQEKQLTTLGKNITAFEVDGTFDDCQKLVKTSFLDENITKQVNLSSANSINLGRLYPQSFYYFWGYINLRRFKNIVFCTPSGNFGNLTAGLIAKRIGLPVNKFIAATNINDVVPEFLFNGVYSPRPSKKTLSNAMDVGNPSNFMRMLDMYATAQKMKEDIVGYKVTDDETTDTIKSVYNKSGYILDPHGAVGYKAIEKYFSESKNIDNPVILLETAHPAKFGEIIKETLNIDVEIPIQLRDSLNRQKHSVEISNDYTEFKNKLLENCI